MRSPNGSPDFQRAFRTCGRRVFLSCEHVLMCGILRFKGKRRMNFALPFEFDLAFFVSKAYRCDVAD